MFCTDYCEIFEDYITNYHFIQETTSTCCLIKPHAIARAGAIIEVLNIMFSLLQQHLILGAGDLMCCNKNYPVLKVLQEEGFRLLGLATYLLTFHQAEEFLEVYRLNIAQFGGRNTNIFEKH